MTVRVEVAAPAARREDAAGERLYPKPASAEEAAAFARDLENAPPSTIDDGFDWLDASDAEPILDPELREQFMGQVQAMKTGSPFLKTLVLRYDKTVRALLAEHAAALSTAERKRSDLEQDRSDVWRTLGIAQDADADAAIAAIVSLRVPSGGET